jgi:peroxiredoxin
VLAGFSKNELGTNVWGRSVLQANSQRNFCDRRSFQFILPRNSHLRLRDRYSHKTFRYLRLDDHNRNVGHLHLRRDIDEMDGIGLR